MYSAILWLLDRPVSVVLKKELQNIPFLKQVFACLGAYALDRSDPRQGMKVMLQMAEDGYTVEKFVYREGDYTVWYTLEPKSYTVYYEDIWLAKKNKTDE